MKNKPRRSPKTASQKKCVLCVKTFEPNSNRQVVCHTCKSKGLKAPCNKKPASDVRRFLSLNAPIKHDKHIVAILCGMSRESNRLTEKYILEGEIDYGAVRIVSGCLRKIETISQRKMMDGG